MTLGDLPPEHGPLGHQEVAEPVLPEAVVAERITLAAPVAGHLARLPLDPDMVNYWNDRLPLD